MQLGDARGISWRDIKRVDLLPQFGFAQDHRNQERVWHSSSVFELKRVVLVSL